MIVVATADFELYHEVVGELRDRGLTFTTIELGDVLPEKTSLIITGLDDDLDADSEGFPDTVQVVRAEPSESRRAVDEALALLRGGDGPTIIGVDPGIRPGIAVLKGHIVVSVFQVPLEDAARVIRQEADEAANPLVRVGDYTLSLHDALPI